MELNQEKTKYKEFSFFVGLYKAKKKNCTECNEDILAYKKLRNLSEKLETMTGEVFKV